MSNLILETVQYSRLIDIDDIEPINDKDYEVLDEIRTVLVKHNYTERFGIALLHKHFEISEDEILVETTDEENRISTIKVENASNIGKSTLETTWKIGDGKITADLRCINRCIIEYSGNHRLRHTLENV